VEGPVEIASTRKRARELERKGETKLFQHKRSRRRRARISSQIGIVNREPAPRGIEEWVEKERRVPESKLVLEKTPNNEPC